MNVHVRIISSLLVAGSLLMPLAAHAAEDAAGSPHPEVYVKDSLITTKIKAKLATDSLRSLANIQVDTNHKGEVVLTGNVATQQEADRAISIARQTDGVTSITSKLKVIGDEKK